MKIVSRVEWGAKAPASRITTTWDRRTEFVVHHSEGPTDQTVRSIQNFHMGPERGWSDIGYNLLVRDDGTIYEGRGWLVIGAHAHSHNTAGIGVCYIGQNAPTEAAKASIRALYDYACERAGRKLAMRGHGQLSDNSTDCPGSKLLAWVKAGMPVAAAPKPPRLLRLADPLMSGPDVKTVQTALNRHGAELTIDGRFGPRTAAEVKAFQKAHGLDQDGIVGPATRKKLGL